MLYLWPMPSSWRELKLNSAIPNSRNYPACRAISATMTMTRPHSVTRILKTKKSHYFYRKDVKRPSNDSRTTTVICAMASVILMIMAICDLDVVEGTQSIKRQTKKSYSLVVYSIALASTFICFLPQTIFIGKTGLNRYRKTTRFMNISELLLSFMICCYPTLPLNYDVFIRISSSMSARAQFSRTHKYVFTDVFQLYDSGLHLKKTSTQTTMKRFP